jgi:hypothetical protein
MAVLVAVLKILRQPPEAELLAKDLAGVTFQGMNPAAEVAQVR